MSATTTAIFLALQVPLTWATIVVGAVMAQGLFAALILLLQRKNRRGNVFLALLLLFFTLWLLDTFFRAGEVYAQAPQYYFWPIYYSLGFGPLVYFYVKALTTRRFAFGWRHVWHFAPVAVQAVLYIFLQTKPYEYRRWFWMEVHQPYTYELEFNLSLISLCVYGVLSLKQLGRYRQWIYNQYSEVSTINLQWLRAVLGLMLVVTVLWLADALMRGLLDFYATQPFSAMAMGVTLLALAIGGLLQSNLAQRGIVSGAPQPGAPQPITSVGSPQPGAPQPEVAEAEQCIPAPVTSVDASLITSVIAPEVKMEKEAAPQPAAPQPTATTFAKSSPATTPTQEPTLEPALLARIQQHMQQARPYLNPDLSLDEFAAQLQVPARKVSWHINQGLDLAFIDFVNRYRVNKVKGHLAQQDMGHLTLLGIALESGFNAKATFNRVFKKMVGMSPSAYARANAPATVQAAKA